MNSNDRELEEAIEWIESVGHKDPSLPWRASEARRGDYRERTAIVVLAQCMGWQPTCLMAS